MSNIGLQLPKGTEDPMQHAPCISLLLAYAAVVPILAGVVWSLGSGHEASLPVRLTIAWAGAVLCFLAGVRRGLSFRQRHGPTLIQLATMLWLFVLAAASLLSPWPLGSLLLQIAGYGTMAVADPAAARRGEVPVYFQRLRPAQMLLLTLSLTVLALRLAL